MEEKQEWDVLPVEEGVRCPVDEFGFYVIGDDQETAPPAPPLDVAAENEETFWANLLQQYRVLYAEVKANSNAPERRPPTASFCSPTKAVKSEADEDPEDEALRHLQGEGSPTVASGSRLTPKRFFMQDLLSRARRRIRRHRGVQFHRVRRIVWPLLTGSAMRWEPHTVLSLAYGRLLQDDIDSDTGDVILRDLGRTLPTHCLFKDTTSVGQEKLRRVLHAYCVFDKEVGYCQGMGFLVAVLLLHMGEEEAFWCFVQMMHGKHYAMRQLYLPGFPLLQRFFVIFRHLLKKFLPRLSSHFEDQGVDVSFFAAQWFLTLFAYQFSVPTVCRIWDLFFSEGWKIVFKVALGLLQWDEQLLLGQRMEEVLLHLKAVQEGKRPDEILQRALDVPVRESDLYVESFDPLL